MLFAYFVYITLLTKFESGILSPMEKSLPWKNKKESLGKEKGKEKTGSKKKERIPFCQERKF